MADWDCNAGKIGINEYMLHSRGEGSKEYGIGVILREVSPAGSHKAAIQIGFVADWDKSGFITAIAPGEYKSYTDPEDVAWRVHVDSTTYNGASSTANVQICYEEAEPAEGQLWIDVPAEAKEGDNVDLCATIKNIGGETAMFFLRFYDGSTMARETSPGNIAAGQTITDVCELFKMPGHAWAGQIELIRQT